MNLKLLVPIIAIGGTIAILYALFPSDPEASFIESAESDDLNLKINESITESSTQNSDTLSIMETNGIKHLIPLDKIKGGGPPKDGIPSIDNPIFADVNNSQFVADSDTYRT